MKGSIAVLARHPVKGFTPERLTSAELRVGEAFPADRLYAVEAGPCGFDPKSPAHVSKMKLAVLAPLPSLAQVRTAFDDATGVFTAQAKGATAFSGAMDDPTAQAAFAAWLTAFLHASGDPPKGSLRVLEGHGHRFMDDAQGHVSVVNLESVRDLGRRMARQLDPFRMRANVYVEGWPAWAELAVPTGVCVTLGAARLAVVKPIQRCIATHVDPDTGLRDADVVGALRTHYGHMNCGLYLRVTGAGRVALADAADLAQDAELAA